MTGSMHISQRGRATSSDIFNLNMTERNQELGHVLRTPLAIVAASRRVSGTEKTVVAIDLTFGADAASA